MAGDSREGRRMIVQFLQKKNYHDIRENIKKIIKFANETTKSLTGNRNFQKKKNSK